MPWLLYPKEKSSLDLALLHHIQISSGVHPGSYISSSRLVGYGETNAHNILTERPPLKKQCGRIIFKRIEKISSLDHCLLGCYSM
jgi:hypothetical protein